MGGRKLEIVPMDNKISPQEAVLLVNQIADRGIRFVLQCCASHVAAALSDAIEKRNSRQPESSMLLFVEMGDDLFAIGKVKDLAPYVAKIRAAKADAIFTGNWGPDLGAVHQGNDGSGAACAGLCARGMSLGHSDGSRDFWRRPVEGSLSMAPEPRREARARGDGRVCVSL